MDEYQGYMMSMGCFSSRVSEGAGHCSDGVNESTFVFESARLERK